jgi:large subunit ribosomal protein L24
MVRVIAGREKGKEGKVLAMTKDGQRVLVEKLNMVKRHQRARRAGELGTIVEKEASIHISNVMPLTPAGKPTRVSFKLDEEGKKVRYSRKHGEELPS